jgi:hypothetical protein
VIDTTVERDVGAQQDLKICDLYKFWALKGMKDCNIPDIKIMQNINK